MQNLSYKTFTNVVIDGCTSLRHTANLKCGETYTVQELFSTNSYQCSHFWDLRFHLFILILTSKLEPHLILTGNTASCRESRCPCCSVVSWPDRELWRAPPPPASFVARCFGTRGRSRPPAPADGSRWSAERARRRTRYAPGPLAPCGLWGACFSTPPHPRCCFHARLIWTKLTVYVVRAFL